MKRSINKSLARLSKERDKRKERKKTEIINIWKEIENITTDLSDNKKKKKKRKYYEKVYIHIFNSLDKTDQFFKKHKQ